MPKAFFPSMLLACGLFTVSAGVHAQSKSPPKVSPGWAPSQPSALPPWSSPNDVPLPTWSRSLVPKKPEIALTQSPTAGALRRGTVPESTRLPLFAALRGPGCAARYYLVGPSAWVCGDVVDISADEPAFAPSPLAEQGLPFRYYFVGENGAYAYLAPERRDGSAPDRELDAGFAVAVMEERIIDGERWGKTRHGEWIAMRELVAARPSLFRGEVVADGALAFGWVASDKTGVFAGPALSSKRIGSKNRFDRVHVVEERAIARSAKMVRISQDGSEAQWMNARDVVQAVPSEAPSEVTGVDRGERWIDVDTTHQTLVAYEGRTPVYATLVSTGKGAEGTDTATPKGVYRIWVKLLASTMDNLENEDAERHYSMEDVPYVQFFNRAVGFHGVFWHRDFGRRRSHGCVNLSPLDAEWLYRFTAPKMPASWNAVLPASYDDGTLVRVR